MEEGLPNKSLQQSPGVSFIAGCCSRLNLLGCNGAAALLNSMLARIKGGSNGEKDNLLEHELLAAYP